MSRIFVSSTYEDLAEHRKAVTDVLTRMRQEHSAMEFFGSRADEAVPACRQEIDSSVLLLGIYAWRYGWIPPGSDYSITEEEFDHAREHGKKCLCYVVSDDHPWLPSLMDKGAARDALERFKKKVSALVRSKFTTPDDLAKQVAADVARELAPERGKESVGGLLQVNWDALSPELQIVFLNAYKRAKEGSRDGVVATRHVVAALLSSVNSAGVLLHQIDKKFLETVLADSEPAAQMDNTVALAQVFGHAQPFSHCVVGSLQRLLPSHSARDRLLAVELASDLLKNGRGSSVEKFRRAGIDGASVERLMRHATMIAQDRDRILVALQGLHDEEVAAVAYAVGLNLAPRLEGDQLRQSAIAAASERGQMAAFVGELMRRKPELLG